jgi:hypothetical protein
MKHPEFFFGVFLMIGLVRNILIPGFQIRGGAQGQALGSL